MAISGFGRDKGGATTSTSSSTSSAPGAGGFGNLTAFIDQGSEFEGKLSFKDTVRIDGCLLYTSPSPRDKRQSRMPSSA